MTSEAQPAHSQPTREFCVFCGAEIPPRGVYCPMCGAVRQSLRGSGVPPAGLRRLPYGYAEYYLPEQKRTPFRQYVKAACAFVILSFLFQLALSMVVLVYGTTIVSPEILNSWTGFTLFLVLPVIVDLVTLSGSALLGYYYMLIAAILISCALFFLNGARPFLNELTMRAKSREHSVIFATIGLLFATLFLSFLVALLASPSEEDLPGARTTEEYLFLLANASVWEEIIVRVLMIGLPMVLVDLVRRKRQAKLRSYVLGGGFKLGIPEVSLLIISSVIFGVAHFTSGWGAWKILPATVGGLAFGYLFLRYGIAASITMHFGTDYITMPIQISDSIGLALITGIGIIVWAAFGAIFFGYYVVRILEFLLRVKLFEPRPQASPQPTTWMYGPAAQPGPYNGQWDTGPQPMMGQPSMRPATAAPPPPRPGSIAGFVCPRCGGIEARWKDGRFECLRCGFLS